MLSITLSDQIFIGHGVGYLGNAATTVAFPVVTIILAVSTLLGAGGSAYAAIKLGEQREEEAEKTLGNLFTLLMGSGILVMILGLIFLDPMLRLFGATDNIMEYSRQYTSILLLGAPFNMLGIGFSNMARTDGNPSLSMYSILVGAILNTILDPIYIFVFPLGSCGSCHCHDHLTDHLCCRFDDILPEKRKYETEMEKSSAG